ncbi:molybdopterin-dependent oxidoreductase [Gluconacetobacter entanii]|uniref:Molybdopterin-dependent oxidoreductase n=1 Tax=Gluconacetobacter entanii TaxID=108528 RepID=A0ABT3K8I8_9PROT|nr:molybdopterin cofactor-binding domain-containing protein [Gluconacetobacter entanii]MCW4591684.1 molybdopterin-dependent oxidoreductase [Gluconacetobacter entanii]MCW4592735.1 molybdopterin-dependent oxidoreductase [Gluconacetobacter entanii]NPC90547.1 xanthine dehydrogenase family protein molybdopterin-binding subunit [Gluconacetobacter entanii]
MGRLNRFLTGKGSGAGQGLSRRGFLVTSLGAGVMFGFARQASANQIFPLDKSGPGDGAFEPTIWCSIAPDGEITVNIIRAEMGQHIGSALARIIADEMEADWEKVRINYVDTDPKWGLMVTGGSWSVWMTWDVFRQAGAATRTALVEEAARLLGTTPDKCTVSQSIVSAANGKQISFGDIVAQGHPSHSFTPEEMAKLPLKPASERRLIGNSELKKALDIPAKTTGEAIYGIDAKVEGMVYARPKMPPTRYGSKVRSVDDSEARKVKGYIRYLKIDDPSGVVQGWVVVLASSYAAAIRATDALKVDWIPGETAHVNERDIQDRGRELINHKEGGVYVFNDDGVDQAFSSAHTVMDKEYTCASVLHYQLEPTNALAFVKDGVYEIHAGNQWQSLILPTLAKALEVPESKVLLRSYLLGGGFGRRLNGDYMIPAALASKALGGKPVKLILTRSDDMVFDSFRSPSVQRVRMAFDASNKITAMDYQAAAGWPTGVMAEAFMSKGVNDVPYDQFAIAGADHWYEVGAFRVRALRNDLAEKTFRPGWLRSVSPGWTSWGVECFLDEVAHAQKKDPVQFRLDMLTGAGRNKGEAPDAVGGALRQAAVLRRLAEKVGWGKQNLPKDTALGICTTAGQERGMPTWIACCAQVHVDRSTGVVRCEKLTIVVDAGTVVDPDGARAQTEGAALWGLSMVLFENTEIVNGQPVDRNLNTYTPLRIADTPEMDIEFLPSTEKPMGLGEPGTTVVGPAIGNAIFNAVGVRLRHMPVRPADVLRGLQGS